MLLDDPHEIARRTALSGGAHVTALDPARAAAEAGGRRVPLFDPLDGGTAARMLLLLETPGPGDAPVRFVSMDNRTPTGANLRRFLGEAGIERRDLVIWNAVPWIVHAAGARNRAVTRAELREGLALLPVLLALLPRLRVVVLAGRPASEAAPIVEAAGLPALLMPHPSPTIVCTSPAIPARIRAALAEAAALLRSAGSA